MSCPMGGVHDFQLVDGRMICAKCSHVSPYPPIDMPAVLKENKELKEYTKLLEAILDDLGYKGMHRKPSGASPG